MDWREIKNFEDFRELLSNLGKMERKAWEELREAEKELMRKVFREISADFEEYFSSRGFRVERRVNSVRAIYKQALIELVLEDDRRILLKHRNEEYVIDVEFPIEKPPPARSYSEAFEAEKEEIKRVTQKERMDVLQWKVTKAKRIVARVQETVEKVRKGEIKPVSFKAYKRQEERMPDYRRRGALKAESFDKLLLLLFGK
jgi:hypothetical protein